MFKKKVLKYLSKTILIGTLALGFISCGDNNKSNEKENPKLSNKNVVHIYSWAEYIPPEVFDNFENVPKVIEHFGLNIELNQSKDKIIYVDKTQIEDITLLMNDSYYETIIAGVPGIDKLK